MVYNHIVSRQLNSLVIYPNFFEFYKVKWVIYSPWATWYLKSARCLIKLLLTWYLRVKVWVPTLVKEMFFMIFTFLKTISSLFNAFSLLHRLWFGNFFWYKTQFIASLVPYFCIILVMYILFGIFVSFHKFLDCFKIWFKFTKMFGFIEANCIKVNKKVKKKYTLRKICQNTGNYRSEKTRILAHFTQ